MGRNVLGTFESIQNITLNSLIEYYNQFFNSDNSILVIAGNISTSQALDLAEQNLGNLSRSISNPINVPAPVFSTNPRVLVEDRNIQVTHVLLAFSTNGIGRNSPLLPEIQVLSKMLRDNVFHRLVYDRGISYVAGGYTLLVSDQGNIVVAVEVSPKNLEEAVDLVINEVNQLKIADSLIQEAKASVLSESFLNLSDTDIYTHFIGEQQFYTGVVKSPQELKLEIQNVSRDSLYRLKQSIFTSKNSAMVILGQVDDNKAVTFDEKLNFDENLKS